MNISIYVYLLDAQVFNVLDRCLYRSNLHYLGAERRSVGWVDGIGNIPRIGRWFTPIITCHQPNMLRCYIMSG